jgi:hypothetical protein
MASLMQRTLVRTRAPIFRSLDTSSPPCLLRSLPAGAVAGWGLHPLEKRRLVTAHVESGPWAARPGPTRLRRNWSPQRGCAETGHPSSSSGLGSSAATGPRTRGNQSTAHHGQSRVCQTTAGIGLASVTEASAASLGVEFAQCICSQTNLLGRFCNDPLPVTVRAGSFMKS